MIQHDHTNNIPSLVDLGDCAGGAQALYILNFYFALKRPHFFSVFVTSSGTTFDSSAIFVSAPLLNASPHLILMRLYRVDTCGGVRKRRGMRRSLALSASFETSFYSNRRWKENLARRSKAPHQGASWSESWITPLHFACCVNPSRQNPPPVTTRRGIPRS